MKRRTVWAQLVVFGVISIAIVSYTVFDLLGVRLTNRPFAVTMELPTGGGIFDGAEVAYRGVAVGRVSAVKLTTGQVTLTLQIDHGERIPSNSVAHVYDLSAVGEQYVDLVPPVSSTPSAGYLHAGSVIPASQTTTPLRISTVLYDIESFVAGLNPRDLQVLGTEGAAAFAGTGPQLKSILADTTTILGQLAQTQDATARLLANSALLLHGAAAHSGDFDTFARSLDQLTSTLAQSTPTIETFLREGAPTTALVDQLIRDNGSAIGVLFANLATLSGIQVARVPGLKALLLAVPQFGRLAPQLANGDALSGVLNFDATQPLCPTGVPLSNPLSGVRTPLQNVNCAGLPRGAENAPRPGSAVAPAALPAARLTPAGTSQVGTYDPTTGLVTGSDGNTVQLGTTGGQVQYLGDESWVALLLGLAGR